MGRISRSFRLVGESYRVLMRNKELMILPLISGVITAAVVALIVLSFSLNGLALDRFTPALYPLLFILYFVMYAVGIFFQAAVVAGATERMRGGNPTVGSALAAAWRRLGPIVAWALVAATVGMIIRAIQDRVGIIGRIVGGLVGLAWTLATFFVVPVLVLEDRPVVDSFTRSVDVFKQTWGETVVGGASLGIAAVCAWLTLIAGAGLLGSVIGPIALILFAVGGVAIMIFF